MSTKMVITSFLKSLYKGLKILIVMKEHVKIWRKVIKFINTNELSFILMCQNGCLYDDLHILIRYYNKNLILGLQFIEPWMCTRM